MTAVKSTKSEQNTSYKQTAALRRAQLAAKRPMLEGELRPTDGKIRIVLSSNPIPRETQAAAFGPSSIDIPELRQARKKRA